MTDEPTIAALFVSSSGIYSKDTRFDAWDEVRDARNYRGPLPVIAHPPCARWCKLAASVEARYPHCPVGIDGGCFASAMQAVKRWGGVLEHPAHSKAWVEYGLARPVFGVWTGKPGSWVTEVWQVDYGHQAQKKTWLFCTGRDKPIDPRAERRKHSKVVGFSNNRCHRPNNERLATKAASATPPDFLEYLVSLALTQRTS